MRRAALAVLCACYAAPDADAPEEVGVARDAIIAGAPDTRYEAVVALTVTGDGTQRCTGTIVKRDGRTATVLTAAHCFAGPATSVTIAVGRDVTSARTFTTNRWELYPTNGAALYDESHDLAIVRFDTATAVPVAPMATPASYASFGPGATFTAVGYGLTTMPTGGPITPDQVSRRSALPLVLSEIVRTRLVTSSSTGSTCFGDSGGALLDGDRLVGINAAVSRCGAGEKNYAVGFFAPEIAAWLREKGLEAPEAPGPNGSDCTDDAACASGTCQIYLDPASGDRILRCGAPAANGFVCTRPTQCTSGTCRDGLCVERASEPPSDAGPALGATPTDDGGCAAAGRPGESLLALVLLALVRRRGR